MDLRSARDLIELRNRVIGRGVRAEAYVTAWMTAVLDRAGLLFNPFIPQTLTQEYNRRIGAGEYDFVALSDPLGAVVVEVKANYHSREALAKAVTLQGYEYALRDKRFVRGFIIATNGFEYAWQAAFCPTQTRRLPFGEKVSEGRLDSANALLEFTQTLLKPTTKLLDVELAARFTPGTLFRTVRAACEGTQTIVWQTILDEMRRVHGWERRSATKTSERIQSLERDLKRHNAIRDPASAKAIVRALNRTDVRPHLERTLRREFGEGFPAGAAALGSISRLKGLIGE